VEISGTRVYSLPQNKSQVVTQTKGGIQEIPKTGAETLLLSSLLLPAGWYIRRKI